MKNDEETYPRFWRIKRFSRRSLHWFFNLLRSVFFWRPLTLALPWATGGYYTILDVWGEKWAWISSHQEIHEKLFCIVLVASLIVLFLKGFISPVSKFESDGVAREILSDFVQSVGTIVQAKVVRFRQKMPLVKKNGNKFTLITHPEAQLEVISNALIDFLKRNFGLKEDGADITIFKKKADGKWFYFYCHQQWKHTDPQLLMERGCAAGRCIEAREMTFIADKIAAASKGEYFMTRRDKQRGDGSAFFYPLVFDSPAGETMFVVSVVTYGRQLCEEHQAIAIEITKAILREFCRRYELELSLETIKTCA